MVPKSLYILLINYIFISSNKLIKNIAQRNYFIYIRGSNCPGRPNRLENVHVARNTNILK